MIVNFICNQIVAHFCIAKTGHLRCCLYREWRHLEWVFHNWFGFLHDAAEEWLDQAASAPGELGVAVPERRETDKALYMSLAMVCKNEALDVVKTVTHKRGFESRKIVQKCLGRRLGRRCTNTRIFWSMTSEPRMRRRGVQSQTEMCYCVVEASSPFTQNTHCSGPHSSFFT